MKLHVNGESLEFTGATLAELVTQMALSGKRLAVEVNKDIVPKGEHGTFALSEGDTIEIIHAIGGG